MKNYELTADTPTSIIREVTKEILKSGVTYPELVYESQYYKKKIQKRYHIPADDLDEVYFCIKAFARYMTIL